MNQDVSWASFTYGPTYFDGAYSFSYAQTETVSGLDPSWATLNPFSEKTVLSTSDTNLAGSYTLNVRGTLSSPRQQSGDASIPILFVKIETTALNDMELSQGRGDLTQAVTPWSYSPNSGDVSSYIFQYTVEL